ncbi:MAG: helix-turn-helix domain-containing protein [Saprospiraceae bacterium]|nr:helix-turn-helix domain-containing protein [Saprospiraceae bacterium]
MKYFALLLVMVFFTVGVAIAGQAEPNTPTISSIDILGQQVDFARLENEDYLRSIPFGGRLLKSFESVLPFTGCPEALDLPHNLNTLTFHFSYPEWKSQHRVRYSYLLSGRDRSWSEPSEDPSVELRDLAPGTYTLQIKARGEADRWTAPTQFNITIRKPWWLSWWSLSMAAILVGMLIAWVVNYLLQRNSEIEEMRRLLEAYKKNASASSFSIADSNDVEDSFLRLVNHTLENHVSDENFGIAELCELLNISRTQLHRKLKKLTGLSTSHYIRSLRLQMAKELFSDQSLNVSEVAFAVGFSSPAYFSKVFKEQFGMSPSEARDGLLPG